MTLMILWGVPGAGKSTFARWLADNKGFMHVDTDAVVMGRGKPTALTNAWQRAFTRATAPAAFVEKVAGHGHPVVAEYGLWADAGNIALLKDLERLGAEPWWFDGYRLAAFAAWRNENRRAGRNFDDEAWHRVVGVINDNWQLIDQFFGAARILRTIEAGPTHVPPETTHAAMQRAATS
jgi:chloramphenicol 3-O-phosphotransferase